MPLPWKTARSTTLSSLLSDLSCRRHRSPLLLQTGFPTSLADLFLKNRSRLKKPSTKSTPSPPPPPPPSAAAPWPVSVHLPAAEKPAPPPATWPRFGSAIVSLLFVVTVAFATTEITLAITALAFALLLLECFRERRLLSPATPRCGDGDRIRSAKPDAGPPRCEISSEGRQAGFSKCGGAGRGKDRIQSADAERAPPKCGPDTTRLECKKLEWKWEVFGNVDGDGDGTVAKTKSAKIGKPGSVVLMHKMLKRLTIKKHRSSSSNGDKGSNRGERSDPSSRGIEIKVLGEEEGEEEEVLVVRENNERPMIEEHCGFESFYETLAVDFEITGVTRQNLCSEIKQSASFWVLLAVILCGLAGGRATAIAATLLWILVVKLVEVTWSGLEKKGESMQ